MPSDQPENISRRHFLAGAAAAATIAVAGCGSETPQAAQSPKENPHRTDTPMANEALRNLRDLGNKHNLHFVDSNGTPVSLAGLQASIGNRWSTMSFMFAACGDTCPITGAALSSVSQHHPELRHIIISVDPHGDFNNKRMHHLISAQGLKVDGPNRNTFILYPSSDGTASDTALLDGGPAAVELQHELGLLTHGNQVSGHNATVTLFDGRGQARAQVLEGPQTIVQTLEANLPEHAPHR